MEDKKNQDFFEQAGHRTIFHELINSDVLPPAEKGTIRIIQEAGAMVGAGGESTTQVLTALTFCLLANPDKLKKLREELRKVMSDSNSPSPTLKQLEALPYLVSIHAIPVSSAMKLELTIYFTERLCQRRFEVCVKQSKKPIASC